MEEKQETVEERGQMDEEAMAADQEEYHRERDRDCMEKEEDGQFKWEGERAGYQSLNAVKMWTDSARRAVRLSRGGVVSQSKEQMGQDGK